MVPKTKKKKKKPPFPHLAAHTQNVLPNPAQITKLVPRHQIPKLHVTGGDTVLTEEKSAGSWEVCNRGRKRGNREEMYTIN